jgi:hypothetical protein
MDQMSSEDAVWADKIDKGGELFQRLIQCASSMAVVCTCDGVTPLEWFKEKRVAELALKIGYSDAVAFDEVVIDALPRILLDAQPLTAYVACRLSACGVS